MLEKHLGQLWQMFTDVCKNSLVLVNITHVTNFRHKMLKVTLNYYWLLHGILAIREKWPTLNKNTFILGVRVESKNYWQKQNNLVFENVHRTQFKILQTCLLC